VTKTLKLLIVTVAIIAGVQGAYAAPIAMRICINNSATCTADIFDGGAGDSNPNNGMITWIGGLGDWTLQVNTGTGAPVLGPATIDLNFNATNTAVGSTQSLEIYFSQTGNNVPGASSMTIGGTMAGGQSITYTAYTDLADNFFATTNIIGTLSFVSSPFSGATGGNAPTDASYSLTQKVVITQLTASNGKAQATGDATLSVPEPSSILLLGTGLTAFGIRRRATRNR